MADLVVQKQDPSWVGYVRQRINKNKNFICFVSGPTGSGKSYCSLAIAEMIDSQFGIDRVVFSGKELMDLINSDKLKRGSVIVFEEAGIEMSNRNWQSITNKMINFLLQTFRHRNFILIMNSPFMDFVDASTRKLFHAELRTVTINMNTQKVKLKPQLIQYNSRNGKFYYKYLRVVTPEGVVPVKSWSIGKPSSKLMDSYEIKKLRFTKDLNKEICSELVNAAKKKKQRRIKVSCKNCNYEWFPRGNKAPLKCPHCKKVRI